MSSQNGFYFSVSEHLPQLPRQPHPPPPLSPWSQSLLCFLEFWNLGIKTCTRDSTWTLGGCLGPIVLRKFALSTIMLISGSRMVEIWLLHWCALICWGIVVESGGSRSAGGEVCHWISFHSFWLFHHPKCSPVSLRPIACAICDHLNILPFDRLACAKIDRLTGWLAQRFAQSQTFNLCMSGQRLEIMVPIF